ncbi:hypothetical protein BE221DRAFT_207264 [Ostreococcus tauri]|uniref:Uncharacterized protein n=1 Tax=Ostreococcus tauri TaxID=70448 RepID=A0A1Y5I6W5_OSTTA|nr:hypothetical protein BE221DRAFT_207264 [Ostreococcus tauri]
MSNVGASMYGSRPSEDAGLLTNERRRRGIPLALQGAIVMAFGLSIAYLMYKLTTEDDDELKVVHARETSDFP